MEPRTPSVDDLIEELSTIRLENRRLSSEVTRLKTEVSDLSYGKLESERPVMPSAPLGEQVLAGLLQVGPDNAIAPLVVKLRDSPEAIGADIVELQAQNLRDQAKQLGFLAIRVTPNNAALHMRWVRQIRYSKDFDLALSICNEAFEVDGDLPLLRLNRGYLLYEAGRNEEAAIDFDLAAIRTHNPIEERLAAAAARAKMEFLAPGGQSKIIADHFEPAKATFEARNLDPAKVKLSLESFGCAWITNLFDTKALAEFDQTITINIAHIEETYRALGLPDGFNVGFPLYFASEANCDKAQGLFKSMYPNLFDPERMVDVDNGKLAQYVFERMRLSGLDVAVKSYLQMDHLYTSAAICHIRSFTPSGVDWFGEFHQDNRLYNSDAEILTLWFPFRYQHGPMPSLEFLPLKSKSHLPCSSVCGIDNEMFEAGAFWRPAYQLGDAMLLSGFVPHRTYVESSMTLERTSIDFRLFASPVPKPIYDGFDLSRSVDIRSRTGPFMSSVKRYLPAPLKETIKSVVRRLQ